MKIQNLQEKYIVTIQNDTIFLNTGKDTMILSDFFYLQNRE